ncbi:MAG: NnrS family protein [Burkholderiales bacterium]|nr:NnrS family protein [Burkholderiales bacterium]
MTTPASIPTPPQAASPPRSAHASPARPPTRQGQPAQPLFFAAASLCAALLLPWSVLAMLQQLPAPARLATPLGHAHEMLLGFALAVIAGYQLPPLPRARLRMLFALWLAARLAFLAWPGGSVPAFALDTAFAAVLALHMTPRLFRAAKTLRNQVLPTVLAALCLAAVAFDAAMLAAGSIAWPSIALAIVLLLAALMTFMGGRLVAAEAAGQLYRQGEVLAPRVQPRVEAAVLLLLTAGLVFAVLPGFDAALRLACGLAGALSLVRMARWRLWACKSRPDLACLASGYAWLALGLVAMGLAPPGAARAAALHLVTIGALGTLTLNVMINTMLLKAKRRRERQVIPLLGTVLIAVATLLRAGAAFAGVHATSPLLLGAACWSLAFVAAFGLILDCSRRLASPTAPRP